MCSMTVGAASGLESDEARCVGEFRTTLGLYWALLGSCARALPDAGHTGQAGCKGGDGQHECGYG